MGLASLTAPLEGNFLHIPFEEATYDGAYSIEATCHAAKVPLYDSTYRFSPETCIINRPAAGGKTSQYILPQYKGCSSRLKGAV